MTITLVLLSAIGFTAIDTSHPPLVSWQLAVPALALAYAAAETWTLPVRQGGQTQGYSLAELPLAIGLLVVSPVALCAGRVIGQAAALHLHRRQPAEKLSFNLSLGLLENVAGLLTLQLLTTPGELLTARACYATIVAVIVVNIVGNAGLVAVLSAVLGTPKLDLFAPGVMTGMPPAIAGGAFGFLAVRLVTVDWWLAGPLGGVTVLLLLAFRAHTTLERENTGLERVAGFTSTLDIDHASLDHVRSLIDQATDVLDAEIAELTIDGIDAWYHLSGQLPTRMPGATIAASLDETPARPTVIMARRAAGRKNRLEHATGLRDAVIVPLPGGASVGGLLIIANRRGELTTFGPRELGIAEAVANHLAVAFANAKLAEQLRANAKESEHRARHDHLTGLPNRSALIEHLRAIPPGTPFGLMLMDLDRFKEVNDALGHAAGDELLIQVADRLRSTLGGAPLITRLGGDEFAIVVMDAPSTVMRRGERIIEALTRPFEIAGVEVEIGASIGLSHAPLHGTSTGDLLQRADIAMYKAKQTESGIESYAEDDDQDSRRRLELTSDLRAAINDGVIALKFQPIIDLATMTVSHFEALARWKHPVHGPVPPDEFVAMAERSGLIRELTVHVMRQAARACRRWQAAGHDIGISINLSARSLVDQSMPHTLLQIALAEGIDPRSIMLEVTESSLLTDPDRAAPILEEMSAAGMQMAIDDFGTGYSSLAYLARLDIDVLKIDRTIVWERHTPRGAAIVHSIMDLGHHLGMNVVAEGVESAEDLRWLIEAGCDTAQGFHIARPMDEEEITRFLTDVWLQNEVHGRSPADVT